MPSPAVGEAASGTKLAFVVEIIEHSRKADAQHLLPCAADAWHGRVLVCCADLSSGRKPRVGGTPLIGPRILLECPQT
jgi:hypothetical protein